MLHRARQLRAGAGCRPAPRPAVHRAARGDLPRHQSGAAAACAASTSSTSSRSRCPIPPARCASTPRSTPPPCGSSATAPGRRTRCSRSPGEHRGGRADLRRPGRRPPGDRARGRAHPGALARQLLGRLDQRLPAPGGPARDLPDRQRTIEATIEWSVACWSRARDLLMRLGVFAGEFSLDAAEAVGAAGNGRLPVAARRPDGQQPRPLADVGALRCSGCSRPSASSPRPPRRARGRRSGPPAPRRLLHAAGAEDSAAAAGPTQLAALERLGRARQSEGRRAPPPRDGRDRNPLARRVGSVPVLVDPRADARGARMDGRDPRDRDGRFRSHQGDRLGFSRG